MLETNWRDVPRTPEEPTPGDVENIMVPGVPYTVSEITEFYDEVSRWTIQRRLESLEEEGRVRKKKHSENRVSWFIPTYGDEGSDDRD